MKIYNNSGITTLRPQPLWATHYTNVHFIHTYVVSRPQKRKRSGRSLFDWGHQKEKVFFKKSDNKEIMHLLTTNSYIMLSGTPLLMRLPLIIDQDCDFYVFSPIFAIAFIPDPHNRLIFLAAISINHFLSFLNF